MIRFSSRNVGTTQSVLAMLAFNFILLVSLAARANAAPVSCPDYVTSLYNDLLHRAPYASEMATGGGWQNWTAACDAYEQGQPGGQTREEILIGFMNSAECQAMPSCVGGAQQMLNNGVTIIPPPPGFGSSFGSTGGVYVTGTKDPAHSYRVLDLASAEQCRDILNGLSALNMTLFQWTRALACNKEATAVGSSGHAGPSHQGLGPVIDPFNKVEPHRGDTIVPGPGIGR